MKNGPDHPHYRLLSDLIDQYLNAAGDRKVFFEGESLDTESVTHMAVVRGVLLSQMATPTSAPSVAWLDGFSLGYLMALNRPDLP